MQRLKHNLARDTIDPNSLLRFPNVSLPDFEGTGCRANTMELKINEMIVQIAKLPLLMQSISSFEICVQTLSHTVASFDAKISSHAARVTTLETNATSVSSGSGSARQRNRELNLNCFGLVRTCAVFSRSRAFLVLSCPNVHNPVLLLPIFLLKRASDGTDVPVSPLLASSSNWVPLVVLFLNLMGQDKAPELWKNNPRNLLTVTALHAERIQIRKLRPNACSDSGRPVD